MGASRGGGDLGRGAERSGRGAAAAAREEEGGWRGAVGD